MFKIESKEFRDIRLNVYQKVYYCYSKSACRLFAPGPNSWNSCKYKNTKINLTPLVKWYRTRVTYLYDKREDSEICESFVNLAAVNGNQADIKPLQI